MDCWCSHAVMSLPRTVCFLFINLEAGTVNSNILASMSLDSIYSGWHARAHVLSLTQNDHSRKIMSFQGQCGFSIWRRAHVCHDRFIRRRERSEFPSAPTQYSYGPLQIWIEVSERAEAISCALKDEWRLQLNFKQQICQIFLLLLLGVFWWKGTAVMGR